ncbi:WD repeat-containing protein wat1 [Smittium mucronatum]|uniref:Target of rapamycin complex subunit LST8 n=1 Tax=Smittium mucronatum TaxID=133383 RepID=A0A1R0H293_9FUNG|nr:WD repeat-containing protein wat1 [Smittium mucronatum]
MSHSYSNDPRNVDTNKRKEHIESTRPLSYEENAVVLVTAGHDHTIRMWDALKNVCTRSIPYNDSQINRMALSPDKRYLAVVGNPHVKLYDVFSPSQDSILSLEGHKASVTAVEFTNDMSYLATSSEDKTVRWWNLRTGACEKVLENDSPVNDLAIIPGDFHDLIATCDQGGNVRVWSIKKKSIVLQLNINTDPKQITQSVRTVAVSPDSKLLVAGNNHGKIFVWSLVICPENIDIEPVQSLKKSDFLVYKNSINSPINDQPSYVSATIMCTFVAHPSKYITKTLFSGNGKLLVTCSADKTAKVWTFKQVPVAESTISRRTSSEHTPSDTASKPQPQPTPQPVYPESHSINPSIKSSFDTTFNKTETRLPSSLNDGPRFEFSAEILHELRRHKSWVWDAAFSNDSGYLVTVSSDKTASLWDMTHGKSIREFVGHEKGVLCVALNDATI